MKKTRYERRMAWKKNRQREIVEHLLLIVLGVIFFIAGACFMATESAEATPEDVWAAEQEAVPIVRGTPTEEDPVDATVSEHETDPVGVSKKNGVPDELIAKLSAAGCVSNDTPELDAKDDQFELLCQVVMAEGGNTEPDEGIRLMADGVLNRVDSDSFPNNIYDVCHEKHWSKKLNRWCWQFDTVRSDAIYRYIPTERVIRICAEEIEKRMNNQVLYWRTGHYHSGTTPVAHVGRHYYSGR